MKILLVEDDPIDLKLFGAVLNSRGHQVREKTSAEQAAEEIKVRKPELILLDLRLPGVSGLELARRLKADPETRDIPIVAITAASETFSREDALAAGCDAYIVKPVDTRKLNDQIVSVAATKGALPEKDCGV